jgi:DNA-binding transcriptional LysR family regulator
VKVHLDYSRAQRIHDDVLHGTVDLGILAYPAKRAHLEVIPFREDRLVLIAHPQHPLATYKHISVKKLHGEAFVGFERDVATRKAIDRILRSRGVTVRYVAEVDNIDTIKRFVEVGQGVAIVPEPAVEVEVKSETLSAIHFSDEKMLRPLAITYRQGRQLSLAALKFIEFLTPRRPADEDEAVSPKPAASSPLPVGERPARSAG